MALIRRLVPHYGQPQEAARANPLYSTLRSLIQILPNGKVVDVIKPDRAMVYSSGIAGSVHGKGIYTNNHADGTSEIQATGACQYQTFSRVAIVRRNYDPTGTCTISDSATSTATGGAQWGINGSEMLLNSANTAQVGISSGAGITTGVEHVMGVTYDGTTVKFFIDGRAVGSTVNARTFTIESAATLFSRGGTGSPNEDLNGAIGLHADFEGALSDSIMIGLTANPWQLFAPRKRDIYIADGTAPTLVLADVAHAHSLDAVSFTQTHNLALVDVAHGHTVEAISLTQDHSIALADVAHAHTVENVVLNTDITLAAADVAHAHTVDAVTFTQVHNLALADVNHAHTVEAISLAQAHNLVQADVTHAHTVENVVLDTALPVANIAHAHTVDAVSFTQTHNLAISNVAHSHTVEAVGFGNTLVVTNITHGFSMDGIVFPPLWTDTAPAAGIWTTKPLSGGTWTTV